MAMQICDILNYETDIAPYCCLLVWLRQVISYDAPSVQLTLSGNHIITFAKGKFITLNS